MPKHSIFIATFPYGNTQAPDVTDWLIGAVVKLKTDPRISDIFNKTYDDTPITMTRNKAVKDARASGADLLLMIDSDMDPDRGVRKPQYAYPGCKPFLDVALPFILNHAGPAVIAAPYCGKPPAENVFIFRPANWQSAHKNADVRVEQFTREEAAQRSGIEEAFALPTGLMLIDMRTFDHMPKPYFEYEWADEDRSEKGSTEDVFFSRNAALVGVKQYVAWDCWAGHWKPKCVFRPDPLTMDMVRKDYRAAVARQQVSNEKLVMVGEGRTNLFTPTTIEFPKEPHEPVPENRPVDRDGAGQPALHVVTQSGERLSFESGISYGQLQATHTPSGPRNLSEGLFAISSIACDDPSVEPLPAPPAKRPGFFARLFPGLG